MATLLFSNDRIGSLRLQMNAPHIPPTIRKGWEENSSIRFASQGLTLIEFPPKQNPQHHPTFYEWQQLEVFFDALPNAHYTPPFGLQLNGQDTALSSQESHGTHKLFGTISLANAVGYSDLVLVDQQRQEVFRLQMEVFPQKLSYKADFHHMVSEVNEILHQLAFDYLRKTYAFVGPDPTLTPDNLGFLNMIKSLGESLNQSLSLIQQLPHHTIKKEKRVMLHHKVRRTPTVSALSHWQHRNPIKRQTHNLGLHKSPSYDIEENRFVLQAAGDILQQVKKLLPHLSPDDRHLFNTVLKRLESHLQHPMWQDVKSSSHAPRNSLLLHQAPGYRDFYLRYLLLKQGLRLQEHAMFKMDYKEISTLYEYWCFLKIIQLLKADTRYDFSGQELVQIKHDQLVVRLKKGQESLVSFKRKDTGEYLRLWYNRRFGKGESYTFDQIPDIFVEFEKKGYTQAFRYVIDAKYRLERNLRLDSQQPTTAYGPPVESISQLHRYRDAIMTAKKHQGSYTSALKSLGGIVLFPYPEEEIQFQTHRFYRSYLEVNIGAIPLSPSPHADHPLLKAFWDRLLDSPPEALYEQVVEYERKDQRRLMKTMENSVRIGFLSDNALYQERIRWYLKHQIFVQAWSAHTDTPRWLAIYDQKSKAIIGYGSVLGLEPVDIRKLVQMQFPGGDLMPDKTYLAYRWQEWNSCFLKAPELAAGGILNCRQKALELALHYQKTDALYLETYAWFRLWEEIVEIDPNCRLQKYEEGLKIRFLYHNQRWTCYERHIEGEFCLAPVSGKRMGLSLENPASVRSLPVFS